MTILQLLSLVLFALHLFAISTSTTVSSFLALLARTLRVYLSLPLAYLLLMTEDNFLLCAVVAILVNLYLSLPIVRQRMTWRFGKLLIQGFFIVAIANYTFLDILTLLPDNQLLTLALIYSIIVTVLSILINLAFKYVSNVSTNEPVNT